MSSSPQPAPRASGRLAAAACAGLLVLSGCTSVGAEIVTQQAAIVGMTAATEPATDRVEVGEVVDTTLEETVVYEGLEYHFTSAATAVENSLTGDAAVDVTVAMDVTNPGTQVATPTSRIALRWDRPNSNTAIEINGSIDVGPVPASASVSTTATFSVPEEDARTFHKDSAVLILGQSSRATAHVPVGSAAQLVTRADVEQPHLRGESFDVGPVTVTIDDFRVRYSGASRSQVMVDESLAEMAFTMQNNGDEQFCIPRGDGAVFSLVNADGEGVDEMRVDELCVRGDRSVESLTDFLLDEDFAGEYTLSLDRGRVRDREFGGQLEITIEPGADPVRGDP